MLEVPRKLCRKFIAAVPRFLCSRTLETVQPYLEIRATLNAGRTTGRTPISGIKCRPYGAINAGRTSPSISVQKYQQ